MSLRVFNQSRSAYVKLRQAEQAVANCACAWVEFGVSVRDLSLKEAIAARNERARLQEPLACAEIPGLVYEPGPGREAAARAQKRLAFEAKQFAGLASVLGTQTALVKMAEAARKSVPDA